MKQHNALRIGIVVGEASGDILGAGLMRALRQKYPQAVFEGIGGPKMLAEGFHSFFPQDRLAVMGLWEPLARLWELLAIRRHLKNHFSEHKPAVFIGIDAPDFNLDLELALRKNGVKTAHYVSPSVWAWRQGRVKKIAKAVDLMLTLFPFEAQFYRDHQVPVAFVGHPLADEIPLVTDQQKAIEELFLVDNKTSVKIGDKKIIALLPGSRQSEVERIGPLFWQTAQYCLEQHKNIIFLVPSANPLRHQQLQQQIEASARHLPIILIQGQSHLVMQAADVVLMASGTTTLEAMLLKRPMVIAYKVAAFTYWLLSKLVKVKTIGLPNLLAGKLLIPEFIQHAATPQAVGDAVLKYLHNTNAIADLKQQFTDLHHLLKQNADQKAAAAIAELIER
jgi:lipid-A-disaccharide synthase